MDDIWISSAQWAVVLLSLKVALVAVLCALPVAIFVAYALVRWTFRAKGVLNVCVHLPLVLPPVVIGYVLLSVFAPSAPLGRVLDMAGFGIAFRWQGAALAAGIMAFPLMVRAVRLGLEGVDQSYEDTAATLGASPRYVFFSITVPLMWPSVVTGIVLGFARALGEFGATITFVAAIPGQTQTLPSAIYLALQNPGDELIAVRLVIISVVIALCALGISEYLTRTKRLM